MGTIWLLRLENSVLEFKTMFGVCTWKERQKELNDAPPINPHEVPVVMTIYFIKQHIDTEINDIMHQHY